MKITTYIFYETNSPTTYFLKAERNDSVDRALDLGLKCLLVGVSQLLESLPCAVEQNTRNQDGYCQLDIPGCLSPT